MKWCVVFGQHAGCVWAGQGAVGRPLELRLGAAHLQPPAEPPQPAEPAAAEGSALACHSILGSATAAAWEGAAAAAVGAAWASRQGVVAVAVHLGTTSSSGLTGHTQLKLCVGREDIGRQQERGEQVRVLVLAGAPATNPSDPRPPQPSRMWCPAPLHQSRSPGRCCSESASLASPPRSPRHATCAAEPGTAGIGRRRGSGPAAMAAGRAGGCVSAGGERAPPEQPGVAKQSLLGDLR